MTIRDDLLPVFADVRTNIIDTVAGLRQHTVYIRRSTPSDARGGANATWTNVDTLLAEKPRVRVASAKDIALSAGRIQDGDYLLDRITPQNVAQTAGIAFSALDPTPNAAGQKVFYVLVGPGLPAYVVSPPSGGGVFTVMAIDPVLNFQYRIHLRPAAGQSR